MILTNWEEKSIDDIFKELNTKSSGLNKKQVDENIQKYGKNILKEESKDSTIKKILMQFSEPLTILLIIAAVISALINNIIDAAVIILVVIINAYLGYSQEKKAEDAIEKLKSISKNHAVVMRDNKKQQIDAEDVTVGDILVVEEGDCCAADIRLIEEYDLKVDESALSGESLPIKKYTEQDLENKHSNIVFMDTYITTGRGVGVVVATGMDTEIGKIATLIQEDEGSKTPLEIKIANLSKTLGLLSIIICVVIVAVELLHNTPLNDTFMIAVSLAVAAIPEGLPAILTLTLALGMQKMARNNVIIRKLLAVETLGSCSVVCTDKTGTLTENKLTVTDSYISNEKMAYMICYLCNNAKVEDNTKIGDPTDISALEFAQKNTEINNKDYERVHEIPLSSIRKRMTTVNIIDNKQYVLIKGAPEIILPMCKYTDNNGKIEKLDTQQLETINKQVTNYTQDALRVLMLAYRCVDNYENYSNEELEDELVFCGIIGMMDPPRSSVCDSIATCHDAGITVKMITGDHRNTASKIAQNVGIKNPENTLTGSELSKLSDNELCEKIDDINVFARVFPEQKVRIIKALKMKNEVVSMTGDGINDAPALTSADIGVAMGSGTDVAKNSSDMILEDDNFSTIVYAIKEGRVIYSNIKRFIKYQISTNIAAIFTILISSLLALPLPFNAIQLLWINIIMDGPPAQSLGVEGADYNIMNNPPRRENILTKENIIHISVIGIMMSVGTLLLYMYELSLNVGHTQAVSVAFTCFVMYQLFNVFNCRSKSKKKNTTLIISVICAFLLQLCVIYIPLLQPIFKTTAIDLSSWILIIIVSLTIVVVEHIIQIFEKKLN